MFKECDAQEVEYESERGAEAKGKCWSFIPVDHHQKILRQCSHMFSGLKLLFFKSLSPFRGKY